MFEEAPGSNIDGEWAGAIRAIKWRDQEGMKHNGCKGTVLKKAIVFSYCDSLFILVSFAVLW